MFDARLQSPTGTRIFITEFLARFGRTAQERGVKIFCRGCQQPVHSSVSEATPERNHFAHYPKRQETPTCDLRISGGDPWAGFFKTSQRNPGNVDRIRTELRADYTRLFNCTNAILRISKIKSIDRKQFSDYLKRAHDLKLWEHDKVQPWMVPFIVLSVGSFVSGSAEVHFRFGRRPGSDYLALIPARTAPNGTVVDQNDFPLSERTVERLGKPYDPKGAQALRIVVDRHYAPRSDEMAPSK